MIITKVELKPAEPQHWIEAHQGSIPLSVLVTGSSIWLYLQSDPSAPVVRHTVTQVVTGHNVLLQYGKYVGTYVLPSEYSPLSRKVAIVGHVYFVEGEA